MSNKGSKYALSPSSSKHAKSHKSSKIQEIKKSKALKQGEAGKSSKNKATEEQKKKSKKNKEGEKYKKLRDYHEEQEYEEQRLERNIFAKKDNEFEDEEESPRKPDFAQYQHDDLVDDPDVYRRSGIGGIKLYSEFKDEEEQQHLEHTENIRDTMYVGGVKPHHKPDDRQLVKHGEQDKRNIHDIEEGKEGHPTRAISQRKGDEASFEYDRTIPLHESQNVFYDDEEEEPSRKISKVASKKKTFEGDATGKFGGSASTRHFKKSSGKKGPKKHAKKEISSPSKDEDFIAGQHQKDEYIKFKARQNRKERMKKFLSGDRVPEGEGEEGEGINVTRKRAKDLKSKTPGKQKIHENLRKEIGKRHPGKFKDTQEKSIHGQPFDLKESRIEGEGDQKQIYNPVEDESKSSFYNIGHSHVRDDR
jgi:hypothetical protein